MTKPKPKRWIRHHHFKKRRSNKKGVGHPAYIFVQSGNLNRYLMFTHDEKDNFPDKVELMHNIDPDDKSGKPSYVLPYYLEDHDNAFVLADKRYRIHKDDMKAIKQYRHIRKPKK